MKVCPFCREEIRDEAIKCRYCSSSLLPVQPPAAPDPAPKLAEADSIVYVLDKGLIRFGKFVAGTLAIFVAIGIYLYGVDIKESGKEVESAARQVQTSADSISKTKADVQQAQADIAKAQIEVKNNDETVTKLVADTKSSLADLQQQVADMRNKEAQATSAAERAQSAEKNIEAQKDSLQKTESQAAALFAQAKDVADQIAQKRQEVDIAVAHIEGYVVVGSAPPEHPASSPAPVPVATTAPAPPPTYKDVSFTATELAKLYHFPAGIDGRGQTIALIELGGGFHEADLDSYFKSVGLPKPKVVAISVDGAANSPSGPADGEVESNIEIAGSVAPGATVAVYFAPNTNKGFVDAVAQVAHDRVNKPSVLSISWGGPENSWTTQALTAVNQALQECAANGITVFAASGDSGATDGVADGKNHVDFPASSPFVTAVGGTHLHSLNGQIVSETVWNDEKQQMGATGHGASSNFPLPEWQRKAGLSANHRAIPDLAANASPSTGYRVTIDGQVTVVGGTAESTPLWAGLVALVNQKIGHNIGYLNPVLYTQLGPATALHHISTTAQSGWDPETGWGSPDGEKIIATLLHQ